MTESQRPRESTGRALEESLVLALARASWTGEVEQRARLLERRMSCVA
jgi:hypothetical protein